MIQNLITNCSSNGYADQNPITIKFIPKANFCVNYKQYCKANYF